MNENDFGVAISELKILINETEMRKYKSVKEHKNYYDYIFNIITNNDNYIKVARIKRKPIRLFFEEFAVLVKYTELMYHNINGIKWRWCGGNEKPDKKLRYDGEIAKNGNVIEKIEIVNPLHCQEDIIAGDSLNTKGYYSHKCEYLDEVLSRNEEKIINNVIKKNTKKEYDNSITLLIVFDNYDYLLSNRIDSYIDQIVKKLKMQKYIFRHVYMLMEKYDSSSLIIDSHIITIK